METFVTTRRPATVERDIPLYLISHFVQREVLSNGEELERVIIRKTRRHFYNISVRTKAIKRELKGKIVATCGKGHSREKEAGEQE